MTYKRSKNKKETALALGLHSRRGRRSAKGLQAQELLCQGMSVSEDSSGLPRHAWNPDPGLPCFACCLCKPGGSSTRWTARSGGPLPEVGRSASCRHGMKLTKKQKFNLEDVCVMSKQSPACDVRPSCCWLVCVEGHRHTWPSREAKACMLSITYVLTLISKQTTQ